MRIRFRSLLIEHTGIKVPGLRIFDLALHRHVPELVRTDRHSHPHDQALIYLSGAGIQSVDRQHARVEAGALVMIPRKVVHAFAREGSRPPLCLMINFRFTGPEKTFPAICTLKRSEVAQIRQNLALLVRLQQRSKGRPSCQDAAVILQLLLSALSTAGWLERTPLWRDDPKSRAVSGLLKRVKPHQPLQETVKQSGYERDYLNRLIKREVGLTLGQFRAQERLKLAKQRLSEGLRISAIAEEVGLPDQSYFARWFRQQTGMPPSRWRVSAR